MPWQERQHHDSPPSERLLLGAAVGDAGAVRAVISDGDARRAVPRDLLRLSLNLASVRPDTEVIGLLASNGSHSWRDGAGMTPLHHAARAGNLPGLRMLLADGQDDAWVTRQVRS